MATIAKGVRICSSYDYGDERDGLFSIHHVPNSTNVCVGYGEGSIDVVATETMKPLGYLPKDSRSSLPIVCLRFNPRHEGVCFAASANGSLFKYDLENNTSSVLIDEAGKELTCFDFSSDGSYCALTGKQLNIRVYDAASFELVSEYSPTGMLGDERNSANKGKIYTLKFHPESRTNFCSGGWDKSVRVWDLRTRQGVVRSWYGPHLCGEGGMDIRCNKVVTASWIVKDALQVWDFAEGKLVSTIPFLKPAEKKGEFLYGVKYCTDDLVMTGGSGTNSARAINIASSHIVGEVKLNYPVQSIDVWEDGTKIAIGGGGTLFYIATITEISQYSIQTSQSK